MIEHKNMKKIKGTHPATLLCILFQKCFEGAQIIKNIKRTHYSKYKEISESFKALFPSLEDWKTIFENHENTDRNRMIYSAPSRIYSEATDSEGNSLPTGKDIEHHIEMPRLILSEINHNWRHPRSCFNGISNSKAKHYRYKFPREVYNITFITEVLLEMKLWRIRYCKN